jgi:alkaline phosphatase
MVSIRARVGWSTHGHSAVDVNIYSSGGPAAERIRGNVENTEVGEFLSDYLGVNVEAITKELRKKMRGLMKPANIEIEAQVTAAERTDLPGSHPAEWLMQS